MAAAEQDASHHSCASQMTGATLSGGKPSRPLHNLAAQRSTPGDVVIEIGPTKIKYRVQEAFLTHYSDYFRKALNGPWKEAEDRVIPLIDIEPATFNVFVEWLYIRRIPKDFVEVAGGHANPHLLEIMLYTFADRFLVPSLRKLLSRQIVKEKMSSEFTSSQYEVIIYAFNNLPPTDPILDWLVDRHYIQWQMYSEAQSTTFSRLPHEFLLRFFKRVGQERHAGHGCVSDTFHLDICSYHEHASEGERVSCSRYSKEVPATVALRRSVEWKVKVEVEGEVPQ